MCPEESNSEAHQVKYMELHDSRSEFVEQVFTDSTCRQQRQMNIKDVAEEMTCKPVGGSFVGNDFHPHKCALGRCVECPEFIPPKGERTMVPNSKGGFISWSRYENQCTCGVHGYLGRKSTCQRCKELPPTERAKKDPQSKLEQVKKRQQLVSFGCTVKTSSMKSTVSIVGC